jgi:hypothetical protein
MKFCEYGPRSLKVIQMSSRRKGPVFTKCIKNLNNLYLEVDALLINRRSVVKSPCLVMAPLLKNDHNVILVSFVNTVPGTVLTKLNFFLNLRKGSISQCYSTLGLQGFTVT